MAGYITEAKSEGKTVLRKTNIRSLDSRRDLNLHSTSPLANRFRHFNLTILAASDSPPHLKARHPLRPPPPPPTATLSTIQYNKTDVPDLFVIPFSVNTVAITVSIINRKFHVHLPQLTKAKMSLALIAMCAILGVILSVGIGALVFSKRMGARAQEAPRPWG